MVKRKKKPDECGWRSLAIRTQAEVAAILGIRTQSVCKAEQRAMRKLARNPVLARFALDHGIPVKISSAAP